MKEVNIYFLKIEIITISTSIEEILEQHISLCLYNNT